jgi:hypothetical protein
MRPTPNRTSGKPRFEVLARAARKLAAVDELALKLELPINADDQQLLKVALSLDQYVITGFLGGDSLHLDTLAVNRTVQAGAWVAWLRSPNLISA